MYFDQSTKIYVAGHRGLVGSAICRELTKQGYKNIITKTHQELDLENQKKTEGFICDVKPDVVFLAAAKVGGIKANNSYPVDFLITNLSIQSNIIAASHKAGVQRLLFLGSSCIYPKNCPQPMREEYLLSSPLEETNRPYALAKISGIEMCWAYNRQFDSKFLAAMPTNLYGPNDNYDLENSHVLPALIRKFHEAKINNLPSIEVWGTGSPKREFLYADDLAKALVHLMRLDEEKYISLIKKEICPIINIGSGQEISIKELALLISRIVGFKGNLNFNSNQPDGPIRKLLDSGKIRELGWLPKTKLSDGIKIIFDEYVQKYR